MAKRSKLLVDRVRQAEGEHAYEFAVIPPPLVRDRASLLRFIETPDAAATVAGAVASEEPLLEALLSDLFYGLNLIREVVRDGEVSKSIDVSDVYTELPALAAEACRRLKGVDGAEDSIQFLIYHVLARRATPESNAA